MKNSETRAAAFIESGECSLGFEFGSTRIKASLISPEGTPLAAGAHNWENRLVDGIWTYDLDEVWEGAASCFADLRRDIKSRYELSLTNIASGGFSAMMHGYLAFDKEGALLTPFRTWRNNITAPAAEELTVLFGFAIPQRWSIAHLHQAILNGEEHSGKIAFLTTLSGYVHWKLTGEKVLGVGDASGMFPIDPATGDYDQKMIEAYDRHIADRGFSWKLKDILPRVRSAGENAGSLSAEGAALLDSSGELSAGIPLCPPEGDAGTGMVATNSISPRTGNVSVGTSVFAMVVLERNLSRAHESIDIVTTPDGKPVAMVHSNNGTSELNAWMGLFTRAAEAMGADSSPDAVYSALLPEAMDADADAGGLVSIGYISGEHITGFTEGRPLVVRQDDADFTLANFLRSLIYSAFSALRIGLDILTGEEAVVIDSLKGHGGIFRTPRVGQYILAAATGVPVSISPSAGEGGAWGMALLAAYMGRRDKAISLRDYLNTIITGGDSPAETAAAADIEGFSRYFSRYHASLAVEREAVKSLPSKENQ